MSPIKILILAAGLLAVTAPSAIADGFRYAGSPKFSQFYIRDQVGSVRHDLDQAGTSFLGARAQVIVSQPDVRKGGISARGL